MPGIIENIANLFKKSTAPRKSTEQLQIEMEAMKSQLDALDAVGEVAFETAIGLFSTAFATETLREQLFYNYRGHCYRELDRHPLAIRDYTTYIDMHPDEWETYKDRAQSYKELEDFDSQIADLKLVESILSKNKKRSEEENEELSNAKFELEYAEKFAEIHAEKGKLVAEFEDILDKARKSNPQYSKHDPLMNEPKRIYSASYEKALKKGLEYDKERNFEIALEYYDFAVERATSDVRAYASRAFCFQSMDYHLDAIDDFQKALLLTADDPNLCFGMGASLSALKRHDEAVMYGDRAIHFASKKKPMYEAYELGAVDRGYKDAVNFYTMMTSAWRFDHANSDSLSTMQSTNADTQEFIREQRKKNDDRMDQLLKRRPAPNA
jgi:tetratricopeptide (TPR) repeat protein